MDIKKMKEKMKSVPFGNSVFQIQHFISNDHTPERNYRNALLQLNTKLNAMEECSFRRRRKEIDIEEIREKITRAESYEKRRLEIDLEEAEINLGNEIKFIEDCVIEIRAYEEIIKGIPEITREDFENAEKGYWEMRLINDARRQLESTGSINPGFLESLEKIGIRMKCLPNGQFRVFGELEDSSKKKLNLIDLDGTKQ